MLLKACLNGSRRPDDHPRCPVTPDQLAAEAAAAVAAGAGAVHVHPRGPDGRETLDAGAVAAALAALREACDVPVGVTTGAWILPDPGDRLRAIEAWDTLPDFASVNAHEDGAAAVMRALLARGVAVEAGVWTVEAATALVGTGLAGRCLRILLEPMDPAPDAALRTAAAVESRLAGAAPDVPRLLHGADATAWPVLAAAAARGWDTRIGLEDTLVLPDGSPARDNADLVRTAAARLGL